MSSGVAWSEDIDNLPQSKDTRKYIMTRLEGQLFGVQVDTIEDILMPQKITPIPLAPPEIKGVLNLRGRIVTAINLRVLLGLPFKEDNENSYRHVVVSYGSELYSLIIDSVSEVLNISPKQIERNPGNLSAQWKEVCAGVCSLEKELMVILDVDRILRVDAGGDERDEPSDSD